MLSFLKGTGKGKDVLEVHRSSSGGVFGSQMKRSHWRSSDQVASCSECEHVFSTFDRKHHCRMCGDVFCGDCTPFVRALDILAQPDPAGERVRVCRNCYYQDREQEVGQSRDHTDSFLLFRARATGEREKVDSRIRYTCGRLSKGIPEKEAIDWIDNSYSEACRNCGKSFGIFTWKHHCRLCGNLLCDECTSFNIRLEHEDKSIRSYRACQPCWTIYDWRLRTRDFHERCSQEENDILKTSWLRIKAIEKMTAERRELLAHKRETLSRPEWTQHVRRLRQLQSEYHSLILLLQKPIKDASVTTESIRKGMAHVFATSYRRCVLLTKKAIDEDINTDMDPGAS